MKPKDDFTNEYDDSLREQAYLQEETNHQQITEWEYLDSLDIEEQTLNNLEDEK